MVISCKFLLICNCIQESVQLLACLLVKVWSLWSSMSLSSCLIVVFMMINNFVFLTKCGRYGHSRNTNTQFFKHEAWKGKVIKSETRAIRVEITWVCLWRFLSLCKYQYTIPLSTKPGREKWLSLKSNQCDLRLIWACICQFAPFREYWYTF